MILHLFYRRAQKIRENRAATKIQSVYKMYKSRRAYHSLRRISLFVQSVYRGMKGTSSLVIKCTSFYVISLSQLAGLLLLLEKIKLQLFYKLIGGEGRDIGEQCGGRGVSLEFSAV